MCIIYLFELYGVHVDVDFEAGGLVVELDPQLVLKEVPDPVKLHYVARLALQPEPVELDEQVAKMNTNFEILIEQ